MPAAKRLDFSNPPRTGKQILQTGRQGKAGRLWGRKLEEERATFLSPLPQTLYRTSTHKLPWAEWPVVDYLDYIGRMSRKLIALLLLVAALGWVGLLSLFQLAADS